MVSPEKSERIRIYAIITPCAWPWWSFGNSLTLPLSQPLWDGYSTCGYTQGDCRQVKYKHFTFAFCSSLYIVLCCQSIGNSSNIFSQRQNNTSIWMLTASRNLAGGLRWYGISCEHATILLLFLVCSTWWSTGYDRSKEFHQVRIGFSCS